MTTTPPTAPPSEQWIELHPVGKGGNMFANEVCQDGLLFRPTGEVRRPEVGESYRGWEGGYGKPYVAAGEVKLSDGRICSSHAIYESTPPPQAIKATSYELSGRTKAEIAKGLELGVKAAELPIVPPPQAPPDEAASELPGIVGCWLIFFEDAERHIEVFTDEAAARTRYKECVLTWHCHLFVHSASVASQVASLQTEVERTRQGHSCFSCGVLWSPETDKEKCPECHRPDEWCHEWVSKRALDLTSMLNDRNNELTTLRQQLADADRKSAQHLDWYQSLQTNWAKLEHRCQTAEASLTTVKQELEEARGKEPKRIVGSLREPLPADHLIVEFTPQGKLSNAGFGIAAIEGWIYLDFGVPNFNGEG